MEVLFKNPRVVRIEFIMLARMVGLSLMEMTQGMLYFSCNAHKRVLQYCSLPKTHADLLQFLSVYIRMHATDQHRKTQSQTDTYRYFSSSSLVQLILKNTFAKIFQGVCHELFPNKYLMCICM